MTIYFNKESEDIEISKQKLELLSKHYKQIADVLSSNEVQSLLKEWQGKQYNKRLETKLKKIDNHFYIDRQFGCYLEYNFYNQEERSIKVEVIGYYNQKENRYIYLDSYKHTIRMLTKYSILENRNIICEDIAQQVLEQAKYYQTKYIKIQNQLFNLNEIIKDYKQKINDLNEFTDSIDSDIKSEFKMHIINQS
jgi:hypothetical protein